MKTDKTLKWMSGLKLRADPAIAADEMNAEQRKNQERFLRKKIRRLDVLKKRLEREERGEVLS